MEAMRASAHFSYDPEATYIVMTPPQTIATGQPVYCGYHTQTASIDGLGNPHRIEYAFIPFLNADWPGLGTGGCGTSLSAAAGLRYSRCGATKHSTRAGTAASSSARAA